MKEEEEKTCSFNIVEGKVLDNLKNPQTWEENCFTFFFARFDDKKK